MLGPLAQPADTVGRIHLFGALLISGGLHLAAFLAFGTGEVSSLANRQFRIEAQLQTRQLAAREALQAEQKSVASDAVEHPDMGAQVEAGEHRPPTERGRFERPRILRLPSELDREPVPLSVPELEPEYGFADDVGGRIVIDVLIGGDGSIIWLYVESSEASQSATEFVTQRLRLSRFEVPTVLGVPVMTFIKIEVVIPQLTRRPE